MLQKRIPHVTEDDCHLYATGRLNGAATASFEAHLQLCNRCRETLAETAKFSSELSGYTGHEKRTERRIPTNTSASMRILNPCFSERFSVNVVDTSRNGLKIKAQTFLNAGMIVQIKLETIFVLGEVRHCEGVDDTFYAGILVQDLQEIKPNCSGSAL